MFRSGAYGEPRARLAQQQAKRGFGDDRCRGDQAQNQQEASDPPAAARFLAESADNYANPTPQLRIGPHDLPGALQEHGGRPGAFLGGQFCRLGLSRRGFLGRLGFGRRLRALRFELLGDRGTDVVDERVVLLLRHTRRRRRKRVRASRDAHRDENGDRQGQGMEDRPHVHPRSAYRSTLSIAQVIPAMSGSSRPSYLSIWALIAASSMPFIMVNSSASPSREWRMFLLRSRYRAGCTTACRRVRGLPKRCLW